MFKKLILIFIVGNFVFLFMKSQEFPTAGSKWGLVRCWGPSGGCLGAIQYFDGDSLVTNWKNGSIKAYLKTRFENNKLYINDINNSTSDKEYILYDFNLTEGDTFEVPFTQVIATVTEVATININHKDRKKIKLTIDGCCNNEMEWVEGIGDIGNSFLYIYQIGVSDISTRTKCFSDNYGTKYKEEGFKIGCDTLDRYYYNVSSLEKNITQESEIILFPNPVEHTLKLKSENHVISISVFDLFGKKLLVSKTSDIDCSKLYPGMYYCKIEMSNKKTKFKEFIKK